MAEMWNYNNYNADFVVITPTDSGRKVWDMTVNMASIQMKFNDQHAFNKAIATLHGNYA